MTFDEDRADLARHEREMDALESFNYAILDDAETKLLGCLYIDPPGPGAPPGAEATASWWVVDEAVGTPLELELSEALPRWLADAWGSGPGWLSPFQFYVPIRNITVCTTLTV